MGPQNPQKLAEHIYRSVGPSGPNKDYLLCLDEALRSLSLDSGDEHVADLARRVSLIEKQEAERAASSNLPTYKDKVMSAPPPVGGEFRRSGSLEEQEETEKSY